MCNTLCNFESLSLSLNETIGVCMLIKVAVIMIILVGMIFQVVVSLIDRSIYISARYDLATG